MIIKPCTELGACWCCNSCIHSADQHDIDGRCRACDRWLNRKRNARMNFFGSLLWMIAGALGGSLAVLIGPESTVQGITYLLGMGFAVSEGIKISHENRKLFIEED